MPVQPSDLYEVLEKLRFELTTCQGMLSSAQSILKELNLQTEPTSPCPHCKVELRGPNSRDEHMYVSHGGPLPEHWLALDARTRDPLLPVDGESYWETLHREQAAEAGARR